MENKNQVFLPFWLTLFLVGGLFIGYKISPGTIFTSGQERYSKLRDVIEILDNNYVDSVNKEEIFDKTIADLLHNLDPHSGYISASDLQYATERKEGHFGGIGVRFTMLRDTLCITNVVQNSPSMKVGVLAGDKIIKVDGKTIAGKKMRSDDIMKLLKGEKGTAVKVVILRGKEQLNKTIIRGTIPVETVIAAFMVDHSTGYIRLEEFSDLSDEEFSFALKKLKKQGMNKLIFDLRNNSGGVLGAAANIVDEFLPAGKVIVTTKGRNYKSEAYKSTGKGIAEDIKVVVLINENSASASEIVAGALQDNDRATIIGRRSFGKGLVQQDIGLKDGSNLRLVVARYYTPTGRSIQKPYEKGYDEYQQDYLQRYENGELFHIDSTLMVDSLKYKTPKGKIVYGGGGIMPDIFIPLDTARTSWYFSELRYNGAFQGFAFDYLKDKRSEWKNMYEFKNKFVVTDALLNEFINYAEREMLVVKKPKDLVASKELIKETLKAEIARQLWTEQGYLYMNYQTDHEILKGMEVLKSN